MGLVKRIEHVSIVFEGSGRMKTEPVKIHLKEDAVQYAVHTVRRVTFSLMPKVKAELQRMEEQGVVSHTAYRLVCIHGIGYEAQWVCQNLCRIKQTA